MAFSVAYEAFYKADQDEDFTSLLTLQGFFGKQPILYKGFLRLSVKTMT